MKCGLLGKKLAHSYSPQIHSYLGDYAYSLFEKDSEEIHDFLKNGDFTGINVTIPYKKEVIPFLDELSPIARRLGAVNTIVRRPDGTLCGHNTDYFGFSVMLKTIGLNVSGKKVLVLGSGGASNTAVAVLREAGANVIIVSRSGINNYDNLHLDEDAAAIVNTTPVGMYPNTGITPVNLSRFPKLEGVMDVIYNPAKTQLLLDAERLGIPCENGLRMLVAQAKESSEWFQGKTLDDSIIDSIHAKLSVQMKNIILIGMPGSGKSTVAELLAKKLNRKMMDADKIVTELTEKTIPEIFAEDGESVFRAWETEALRKLGKESGLIIATGGGCVTRSENYPLLHQNGEIFWLQRDPDILPTDGRPLSQKNDLNSMYKLRQPMYQAFSDHIIDNNSSLEQTVTSVLRVLEEQK